MIDLNGEYRDTALSARCNNESRTTFRDLASSLVTHNILNVRDGTTVPPTIFAQLSILRVVQNAASARLEIVKDINAFSTKSLAAEDGAAPLSTRAEPGMRIWSSLALRRT